MFGDNYLARICASTASQDVLINRLGLVPYDNRPLSYMHNMPYGDMYDFNYLNRPHRYPPEIQAEQDHVNTTHKNLNTTLTKKPQKPYKERCIQMHTDLGHHHDNYLTSDVFPLEPRKIRQTTFPTPKNTKQMLIDQYGDTFMEPDPDRIRHGR